MVSTRSQTELRAPATQNVPISEQDELVPIQHPVTFGFKVCLALLAIPCYAVTPAMFLFFAVHLYRFGQVGPVASNGGFYRFWLYMSYGEIPFTVFFRYLCRRAQELKTYPIRDNQFLQDILLQCLSVGVPVDHKGQKRRPRQEGEPDWTASPSDNISAVRKKYRAWFFHAPMSAIKADNVREWLAWAIGGGRTLEDVRKDPELVKLIDNGLRLISTRLRYTFPEGYNPEVKCLRLTLDPVRVRSRPLGYYVVCNGMTLAVYAWLIIFHGFRFRHSHGSQLLVKAPARKREGLANGHSLHTKLPVVFLHGLGIGLAQYTAFLKHLARTTEGVVILLQPNISTQIFHPRFLDPPSKEDYVAAIQDICGRYDIKKANIVSHSNGTMVHGWLLRGCPELCNRNVLVDPVCFRLWEGDVCYTFLYQRWRTAMNVLLGYFVARELGTAHSIARDFQWVDMILWEHELPSVEPDRFRTVFGTNDSLLDTANIVDYLDECGVPAASVKVIDGYNHGQALIMNGQGMNEVLDFL